MRIRYRQKMFVSTLRLVAGRAQQTSSQPLGNIRKSTTYLYSGNKSMLMQRCWHATRTVCNNAIVHRTTLNFLCTMPTRTKWTRGDCECLSINHVTHHLRWRLWINPLLVNIRETCILCSSPCSSSEYVGKTTLFEIQLGPYTSSKSGFGSINLAIWLIDSLLSK